MVLTMRNKRVLIYYGEKSQKPSSLSSAVLIMRNKRALIYYGEKSQIILVIIIYGINYAE